jgi:hypothetical protein
MLLVEGFDAVLEAEVHNFQVEVLLEPVLGCLEDLQLLGGVLLQVVADLSGSSYATQIELLLQDEERRVYAWVVRTDCPQIGGDLQPVVISYQRANGSLMLHIGNLKVMREFGGLPLGNAACDRLG